MVQSTAEHDQDKTFLVKDDLPLSNQGANDDSVEAEGSSSPGAEHRRPSRRQPSSLRHSRHMSSRLARVNNYQLLSLQIAEESETSEGTKSLSNGGHLADLLGQVEAEVDGESPRTSNECDAPIGEILVDRRDGEALDDSLYSGRSQRRCSDVTTHSAFEGQSGEHLDCFNSSLICKNKNNDNNIMSLLSFNGDGSHWNDSFSTAATDCSEGLAKLAQQLTSYDMDPSLDSSINSFLVAGGINDSTNLGKPKGLHKNAIDRKGYSNHLYDSTNTSTTSVTSFNPETTKDDLEELFGIGESISSVQFKDMLDNSLVLAGGIQDSTKLYKAKSISKSEYLSSLNGSSSTSILLDHMDLPPQLLPKNPSERRKRTFTHRSAKRRGYAQDTN